LRKFVLFSGIVSCTGIAWVVLPNEGAGFAALLRTCLLSFCVLSFLSFRAHARNPVWMLHCAYAPFSMTDDVIPNAVRNPVWMLRYAQHDKSESNHGECSFLSFRAKRGIQCGSAKEFNRAGMANLTLLSLSFKRRGTFRHRRNRVRWI